MKKLLSIIIALALLMTSSFAFADSHGKGRSEKNSKNGYYKSESDYMDTINYLITMLKNNYKDKEAREDILAQILEIKEQNKYDSLSIFTDVNDDEDEDEDDEDDEDEDDEDEDDDDEDEAKNNNSIIIFADNGINDYASMFIFIDGELYNLNEKPVIKHGNIRIPVKAITKGLGAELKWNQKTKTVTITKDSTTITIRLDKKIIMVDGIEVPNNVLKKNSKNMTVALFKFIVEMLGENLGEDEPDEIVIEDDGSKSINDNIKGIQKEQFEYVGKWKYADQKDAFFDDNHWSNSKNSYYRVRFKGKQVKVYGAVAPNHGFAAISIDGKPEVYVDCYADKRTDNVLLYTSPVLKKGQHTIKVRVTGARSSKSTGSYINADRVNVIENIDQQKENNIALNKNSFTDSAQVDNGAVKGNDGNISTRWCASDEKANHWWTVDLGNYYNITGSEVVWEKSDKVYKYKVEVSADNINWTTKVDKTASTLVQQTQNDSYTASQVRFVRITVTGLEPGAWASFYEFRVFGAANTNDTQAPTVPTGLTANAASTSQVGLSWAASNDNTAVTGYKIFRNGKQVASVGNTTSFNDTGLTPGTVYVYAVSAFDAAGNQSAQSTPVVTVTPLVNGSGTGLKAEYFNNIDLTDIKTVRVDDNVDFNWMFASPIPTVGADRFSVRWTGQIMPLYSETYTFHTKSDDGVRLWINGTKVIDNWGDHTLTENSGTITLAAGQKYDIKLEYYDNSGLASISLLWSSNSQTKQVVPKSQLFPAAIDSAAPTAPTGLTASAISAGQINLAWNASTDNVGVVGYKVYRNGKQIGVTTNITVYSDTGLEPNTPYIYAVQAFDAAGNTSAQSLPALATTQLPASTNIALNKTASADSQEASNPASKANDGNILTRWCAADGGFNHWWKVDLGKAYNLTGSEVTWEHIGKVYKYRVEVSSDDINWTVVANKMQNTSTQQTQTDSYTVNSARYVRVTVTGFEPGCWASFSEFKVFGYETVTEINDNSTGTGNNVFNYNGNWGYGYQTGAYMNDNHWSVDTNAYYQIQFYGTQIKLYASKDPSFGIASVTMDGVLETNVDLYAANRTDNTLVYTSPILQRGLHVLKVKVTGTKNSSSSNYYINADKAEIIN